MSVTDYDKFLERKRFTPIVSGLTTIPKLNSNMFPHQRDITSWALRLGRAAAFLGTGLGKSLIELDWSRVIAAHTGMPVLLLAPLAVCYQMVREAEKFGISGVKYCHNSSESVGVPIVVTNYERLEHFDPSDYSGVVLDESSCLKAMDGVTKNALIESFKDTPYKLCGTATPSPNDVVELGNHAEFLGVMTATEMLSMFFTHDGGETQKWRLKGHARKEFWKWVCSWAVNIRQPGDVGYNNDIFVLPELNYHEHIVSVDTPSEGMLFAMPAETLGERLAARRSTVEDRIAKAIEIVCKEPNEIWLIWTNLNKESELVTESINGAVEVTGSDPADYKAQCALEFAEGKIQTLVSKSLIFGFGCNLQICSHMIFVGVNDCYDEQTELLTREGWKHFSSVSLNDDVATVNQKTLALEWQNPTRVVWEPYTGDMVRFSGRNSLDLLVTPNHNVFLQVDPVRYKSDGMFHLHHADDVVNGYKRLGYRMLSVPSSSTGTAPKYVNIPIPKGRRLTGRFKTIKPISSDTMMRLAGWYISEGYCRPMDSHEAGRIVICQTDIHPNNREEIISIFNEIGITSNHKTKNITAYSISLAEFLYEEFGTSSYDKRIPLWVKDMDSSLLSILIDTMMKGYGCHSDGSARFYRTNSKQLADDFQQICIKVGVRASVKERNYANRLGTFRFYDVQYAKKYTRPYIYQKPTLEHYEGMIGCVTVPNHTVVVRRNGIPVVSGNSFEQFYQSVRRCHRFGQTRPVHVHIIAASTEGNVLENLKRKERESEQMANEMVENMQDLTRENLKGTVHTEVEYERDMKKDKNWEMHLGDCVDVAKDISDNSIHYHMTSLPFDSLYTYSASERDMGNNRNSKEFWDHYQFLIEQTYRIMVPGRLVSVHCMNMPTSKVRDGYIGIRDFRGEIIRAYCGAESATLHDAKNVLMRLGRDTTEIDLAIKDASLRNGGFIYHSEVLIWKDPVVAMQRTKALGLLHKQICKDSCMSRQGVPDYLITFRKPGINPEPVTGLLMEYYGFDGPNGEITKTVIDEDTGKVVHRYLPHSKEVRRSIEIWQRYASPVWTDINPSDTLQYRSAREHADERHICPLQLDVIRRGIQLWSNPGDLVYDPFAGIGSTGYVALEMGRRFVGSELKRSYYDQSVKNLGRALSITNCLFAGQDEENEEIETVDEVEETVPDDDMNF